MLTSLLPLPSGLMIVAVEPASDTLIIQIGSCLPSGACPLCGGESERIHSRYTRTLADLPLCGQRVRLVMTVRRFFCGQPTCARKLFAEQFPDLTQPRSRMTSRLVATLQTIGLATSGEGGARLATRLGMPVSPTTLLRRVMELPRPADDPVEVLGVDDFSFRRGRTYGTILVNLATHRIIDLLPDRSAVTVATWMRQHPEIRIVSRDRGQEYAQASREGAPQAQQVADRFHLMANLVDAIDPLIARFLKDVRRALRQQDNPRLSHPAYELTRLAHLALNQARFDAVMQLHQQHMAYQVIAEQLEMSVRTVRRWIKQGICPDGQRRRRRPRPPNPHEAHFQDRWQQGCHDLKQLTEELRQRGYTGSQRTVYRFLSRLQNTPHASAALDRDLTARHIKWLLVQPRVALSARQRQFIDDLCMTSPPLRTLYELVQSFGELVRCHEGWRLSTWQQAVRQSGLPDVMRFATGLDRDREAVVAGLTLATNNGMVEGFVNKVKLLKRQGYGQAGFALLRHRILHTR